MNAVELHHVHKAYRGFALQDISFAVRRGYITGFIGPNGAGKSTTIRLIMDLVRADQGRIEVFGKTHNEHPREIKERIGFVYDEPQWVDTLRVREMARMIAPFYRSWDETLFQSYLKRFGVDPAKRIKELSKGMKTKLSLAAALSHEAELIVMDEPTAGLDPLFRREILEILSDIIQDERKAVFFSTHVTADLDRIADYIVFIHEGRIVLDASKDDIREHYVIVKGDAGLLDDAKRSQLIGFRQSGYGFEGLMADRALARDLFGPEALYERPVLEDIMYYTVRGNAG